MKKNYFFVLFASLMLFMAMPASAQVESMADLYGTYRFTATITPTAAGEAYKDVWQSECEVIITKDTETGAPALIKGLMGAEYDQLVSAIDVENKNFYVNNPNPNYGLWSDYIGVTEEGLDNPQMYTMYYNYDPATKEITIPDFQIAGFSWPAPDYNMTATVYANVTNAKLTLIESESIEIANIAGEWSYKPYSMDYVRNDSTFVYEFKINLEAKDDTNKEYIATFSFEGYDEFTLDATFNGVDLVIPFDNLYLDAEQKIRFGIGATSANPENVFVKSGQFSFSYSNSTFMWQGDYIYIRQEGIATEEVDGVMVEKEVAPIIQSMTYGWIEREDPNAYDWSGVYTVAVPEEGVTVIDESMEFPSEFTMVISKVAGGFAVTEFMGYSDYYVNYPITVNADGKSAEIDLTSYYGPALLTYVGEVDGDYFYHVLSDGNGEATSLRITLQDDGSIALGDFCVQSWYFMANDFNPYVLMSGATAAKKKFDWTGEYVLTSTVDNSEYPSTFDVTVKYNDSYPGYEYYYIDSFMGNSVYEMNYGGIALNIADDNNSAEIDMFYTNVYSLGGGKYLMMRDENAGDSPIALTLNADQTITVADFTIVDPSTSMTVAKYSNVLLTKKNDTAIENVAAENAVVKGIFDIQGRKIEAIAAPGLYIVNGKKVLVK